LIRTSLSSFVPLVVFASVAHASPVAVLEDVDDPSVEDVQLETLGHPAGSSRTHHPAVATVALWGGSFDLRTPSFGLDTPEIEALTGSRIAEQGLTRLARIGGLTFGGGYKPLPWLRIPEIRLSFGVGNARGSWVPSTVDPEIEVRASRASIFRIEILGGFEYDLGPVTPFVRGFAAAGAVIVAADVRESRLGRLGTERVGAGFGALGTEVGVEVRFRHEQSDLGIQLGYRRTLVGGPSEHALMVGLAIRGD